MASTMGGDDAQHGLSAGDKDREEKKPREEALELLAKAKRRNERRS